MLVPPVCGLENLPTNRIFLPSTGGFSNRKTLELCRAEVLQRLENIGPEPRILGRKILLVGKFLGDEPARLQARSQQRLFLRSEEL